VIVAGLLVGGGLYWVRRKLTERFDVLIVGGLIIDGSGAPATTGTIGVRDGKIVNVDWPFFAEAERTISAEGLIVCPGFIDVHTHIEGNVRANSKTSPLLARNFVVQGVTSIITGNCGTSAASLEEFFEQLLARGIQINVGSLIGHNTVRRRVMREVSREPTRDELAKMRKMVARAMKDGAMGFSTGLEYNPGAFASSREIETLAAVAARRRGVYATHIRDEGNHVAASLREAIEIARHARISLEVSHLKVRGRVNWGQSLEMIALLDQARNSGVALTCDFYPYTASSTSLDILVPKHHREGGAGKLRTRLRDPREHERIVADVIRQMETEGWNDFSFARVASCDFAPEYNGLTIPEIARLRAVQSRSNKLAAGRAKRTADQSDKNIDPLRPKPDFAAKPIARLATPSRGRDGSPTPVTPNPSIAGRQVDLVTQSETVCYLASKGGAQMIYENMSEGDVLHFARLPYSMLGSDSGIRTGEGRPHPRGFGAAARILAHLALKLRLITMEEAVRKMTWLPADTFRIEGRGRLLPGYWADIVIFDPASLKDMASYREPFREPEGITYVLVNGVVALDHGKTTSNNSGRVIRRGRQ
jgi:N-acyl-D-amino-acid deacylase